MDFNFKKKVTSAMRKLVGDGAATTIIFTANHRALRHCIASRTSRHAEEQIRMAFNQIFDLVKDKYPAIYQDSVVEFIEGQNEISFTNAKV